MINSKLIPHFHGGKASLIDEMTLLQMQQQETLRGFYDDFEDDVSSIDLKANTEPSDGLTEPDSVLY